MRPGTGSKPTADPESKPSGPLSSQRVRVAIGLVGSLIIVGVLVAVIVPRAGEVGDALGRVGAGRFVLIVLLGVGALILRTTAWQIAIDAAGGRLRAREAHPASAASFVVGLVNPYIGVGVRIAVIRHRVPERSPTASQQVAAESVLIVVEAVLVGFLLLFASWTLEIPFPVALAIFIGGLVAAALLVVAARRFALRRFGPGLAVARQPLAMALLTAALAGTLILQITRVAVVLHSVGLSASLIVVIAVFLASGLGAVIPVGTAATGAAAPLIAVHGGNSVADATAAGVVLSGGLLVSTLSYLGIASLVAAIQSHRFTRKEAQGDL
jgi:Lysylphosphatidylglycerol synthase TM region